MRTETGTRKQGNENVFEVEIIMRTKIENYIIGNRKVLRMMTVAATLFCAGAARNNNETTDREEGANE